MSMATVGHLLTELVNQGSLPLGVLLLAAPYLRKGKFVTAYRQTRANVPPSEEDEEEDSVDSGYMEDI